MIKPLKKKASVKDDHPLNRMAKEREYLESLKEENEILKIDLNRENKNAYRSLNLIGESEIIRFVVISLTLFLVLYYLIL